MYTSFSTLRALLSQKELMHRPASLRDEGTGAFSLESYIELRDLMPPVAVRPGNARGTCRQYPSEHDHKGKSKNAKNRQQRWTRGSLNRGMSHMIRCTTSNRRRTKVALHRLDRLKMHCSYAVSGSAPPSKPSSYLNVGNPDRV
jgi:hypothetical protein